MYPDVPDNLEEDVRHQPEGEAQALKQEKVQPEDADIVEGEIHNYATKFATALGIVQIVCGVVTMGVAAAISFAMGSGLPGQIPAGLFLPSVFFFVSGTVCIQGASQRSRLLARSIS